MELALLILLVIFSTNVVSWIGKSVLVELAFSGYQYLFLSSSYTKQRALKKDILSTKAELNATSSQDQFAKWAKLRRKLDRGMDELTKINTSVTSQRSGFNKLFSTVIYIFTSGFQLVICWYYRRQPVFWMPYGWAPGIIGWLLSFGGGPRGSISVAAWSVICKRVVATAEDLVKAWVPQIVAAVFPSKMEQTSNSNIPNATTPQPKLSTPVPAAAAGPREPVPIEDDVIEVD